MSRRIAAKITGVSGYVPPRVMTNADMEKLVDTDDAWIRERTGIRERHVAEKGVGSSDLATAAARQLLASKSVPASEIDLIVVASVTPDMMFPATACLVQNNLGATNAWGFDLSAACSGFLYALTVAAQFVGASTQKKALAIGSDVMTSILYYEDRATCVLFGDGAGATIVQRSTKHRGILSAYMRSDGTLAKLLYRPKGGAADPVTPEIIAEGSHYVHMQGREVFKNAVRSMAESAARALDMARINGGDIDLLIPHQANLRIIEATAKHASIPMEKVFVNVDRYGNTSAASIPIALDEALRQGRIADGSTVMFVAFGAGFTWGSMVVRF